MSKQCIIYHNGWLHGRLMQADEESGETVSGPGRLFRCRVDDIVSYNAEAQNEVLVALRGTEDGFAVYGTCADVQRVIDRHSLVVYEGSQPEQPAVD